MKSPEGQGEPSGRGRKPVWGGTDSRGSDQGGGGTRGRRCVHPTNETRVGEEKFPRFDPGALSIYLVFT